MTNPEQIQEHAYGLSGTHGHPRPMDTPTL